MGRYTTKYTGVIYRDSITNSKPDKTYYIRYKNKNNQTKEMKVGKYSEGIRENYCNQIRNEIITKERLGDEAPNLVKNKRTKTILIEIIAKEYFDNRLEKRSIKSDYSAYTIYIQTFFKDIDLNELTAKDLHKFTEYMRKCKGNYTKRELSNKTINNALNLFKTIIKYGFKNDYLKEDKSKYVKLLSIDNARERFLSKDEIKILFENSKNDDTLFLIYKLALYTGARLATILNISIKDIDNAHNFITLKDFKNDSTYKSFMTDELKNLLEKYTINHNIKDKFFIKNPQRRLRELLNNLFNENIDNYDRKNKVVFHTLRHTFASHLAINGTPIFTIQKLMNHKDIKMTLRYAKLAPNSGENAIKDLY